MLKPFLYAVLSVILFCTSSLAEFPNLGGFVKGVTTSNVSISELLSTKAKVLSTYISSMQELSVALDKTATAFGIKNAVAAKLADIKALTPKNISDALLEKARQSSQSALAAIQNKMQASPTLSSGSVNLLAGGLKSISSAMQKIETLIPQARSLVTGAGKALISASGQDKTKIQDVLSIGSIISKSLPLDLKTVGTVASVLSRYATAQDITLPQGFSGLTNLQ